MPEFKLTVPGSGTYNIPSTIGTGKAATIKGRPSTTPLQQRNTQQQLGPGSYNISNTYSKTTSPAYTMRPKTQYKYSNTLDTPAPGAYNNLVASNAPKITLAARTMPVKTTTEQTPG